MNYESNLPKVIRSYDRWEDKALHWIGSFVRGKAVMNAPVDTGNLRGGIDFKIDERQKSVGIGTDVEYAIYQEKGTRKMKAQPFLTPAVEDNVKKIRDEVARIRFG